MKIKNIEKQDLLSEQEKISVNTFSEALELETIVEGKGEIVLTTASVCRPGLQLTGYFAHFEKKRVQVIGNAEHEYLLSMDKTLRKQNLDMLIGADIPCLVFANSLEIPEDVLSLCQKYNCPLFKSKQTTAVLIHEIMTYLGELLAPSKMVHAVLMEVFGVGILIEGQAGIGKSETALDLIIRGHRLVADDSVIIKNMGENLIGKAPRNIRYYMEVRGIGIINVQTMYGPGAIRPSKSVDLVIELVKWDNEEVYDRLGDEKMTEDILGVSKPKLKIPVSPGRNIPAIIETAARKFRLDQTGYDATSELIQNTFSLKN